MKIQCYVCRKIFPEKEMTIMLDLGDFVGSLSGCWHVPLCKECFKDNKEELKAKNERKI